MACRLVFNGAKHVACEDFTPKEVGDGEVRLRTLFTLMSTGTENIVFNRLFEAGTHWDKWVKYPFYPGYATVGEIIEAGPNVSLKPGQLVVSRNGHASEHVTDALHCHLVPEEIDPRQAPWFALAKIAAMGARAADVFLGDGVLVIGAGPIGQMALRWVRAAGAYPLIVADMVQMRLDMALAGGATHVVARPVAEALDEITEACGGDLPRVVIDTTGSADVFASALGVCRRRGRLVVLGDTGAPGKQHLTSDAMMKGITIVPAHDGHEDAEWNSCRIIRLFFDLVRTGRFSLEGLNTHVFTPQECVEAYRLANARRGETMGILFDWTEGGCCL